MSLSRAVISVVVDNDVAVHGFESTWGLSLHVKLIYDGVVREMLFDVSGDFGVWHRNAKLLRINPRNIDAIVISHWHGDHAGALEDVLKVIGRDVPVYAPSSFRRWFSRGYDVVECGEGTEIFPGVYTTGTLGYTLAEHALAIKVGGKGLVVLVGCSHPGLAYLVRKAMDVTNESRVYLVMGGFHISSELEGMEVAEELKNLGTMYVAPMHCTGSGARSSIRKIFSDRYIALGAGSVIKI